MRICLNLQILQTIFGKRARDTINEDVVRKAWEPLIVLSDDKHYYIRRKAGARNLAQ